MTQKYTTKELLHFTAEWWLTDKYNELDIYIEQFTSERFSLYTEWGIPNYVQGCSWTEVKEIHSWTCLLIAEEIEN